MVEIKIISVKENKLLRRKEITFEINHLGAGTPDRMEVKAKLAAMQTANAELTFIKKMTPVFGLPILKGIATIYDEEAVAKRLESAYMQIRNMAKDKRDAARKALKKGKKKKKKEA